MIAAVVTEETGTVQGRESAWRTCHADPECARIKKRDIVARGVDASTRDAGLTCEWCWPRTAPEIPDETSSGPAQPHARRLVGTESSTPGTAASPPSDAPAGGLVVPVGWSRQVKSNRFSGKCIGCGSTVQAGAGWLCRRNSDRTFGVLHREGDCQPAAGAAVNRAVETRRALPDVPEGYYAVASLGSNDLLFVRVKRPTEGQWAGRVFVDMVIGGRRDQSIRGDRAAAVLERIVEVGIVESARRYGQEIGKCCRCNRTLTDEESRRLGIGPECRRRT